MWRCAGRRLVPLLNHGARTVPFAGAARQASEHFSRLAPLVYQNHPHFNICLSAEAPNPATVISEDEVVEVDEDLGIATGLELQEFLAEKQGKGLLDLDALHGPFGTKVKKEKMLVSCSRQLDHRSYVLLQQASQFASSATLREAASHSSPRSPSTSQGSAKLLFSSKPRSLSVPLESKLRIVEYERTGFTGFGLRLLGYYKQESKLFRGARTLYYRLYYLVESPELYATFGLEKCFRTRLAMSIIHVWMCLVRVKSEKPDGATFGKALYDLYNEDLEHRVAEAGVKIMFSKWMKELEKMFYGAIKAYDEAMKPEASKDDLAQALWRNVFSESDAPMPSGEQAIPIQRLANYIRRETACLAMTDTESIFSGNIIFSVDVSWKKI